MTPEIGIVGVKGEVALLPSQSIFFPLFSSSLGAFFCPSGFVVGMGCPSGPFFFVSDAGANAPATGGLWCAFFGFRHARPNGLASGVVRVVLFVLLPFFFFACAFCRSCPCGSASRGGRGGGGLSDDPAVGGWVSGFFCGGRGQTPLPLLVGCFWFLGWGGSFCPFGFSGGARATGFCHP